MKTKEFNYFLPKELIAQKPIRPRDHSRLLILERKTGKVCHDCFFNLGKYLKKGDVLVLNNSRVFPARLIGQKPTGGKVEILLVKELENGEWECLVRSKIKNQKLKINIKKKKILLTAELIKKLPSDRWLVRFSEKGEKFRKIIYKIGQAPTPPYIKRISNLKEYQTIYAKKDGSIAAPTAGFHFTKKLIRTLKKQGIKFKFITLHVGLGTFLPIKTEKIEKHKMLAEMATIDNKTAAELNKIKSSGGRIIAVGTSTVRSLESAVKDGKVYSFNSQTNLFIKPGYKFSAYGAAFIGEPRSPRFAGEAGLWRGSAPASPALSADRPARFAIALARRAGGSGGKFIDGLITNFHLPRSTNLVLVSAFAAPSPKRLWRVGDKASADKSAFAGKEHILKAYQEAIKRKYRFYSFGDAMLII